MAVDTVENPPPEGAHVRDAVATRAAIHDTALRLFSTLGFAGTGIRSIAQESGISLASLYHYINTKEDLLVGILKQNILTLLRDAEVAVQNRKRAPDRVVALVEVHVRIHAAESLQCIVSDTELRSLSEKSRRDVVEYRDTYEEIWRSAIADGMESGEFTTLDITVVKNALLEMCTGVAHWYRNDGRLGLDEITAIYSELALRMLGALPARRSRTTK